MATEAEYQRLLDQFAELEERVVEDLAPGLIERPELADALLDRVQSRLSGLVDRDRAVPPPPDFGLSQLVGLGPDAARSMGEARMPQGVAAYDETVARERVVAIADLYYLYQHEKIGVFRAVKKLQELFRAGTVRLSSGPGAYGLYRFDRREVLRYTRRDRLAAYRRAFGYGSAPLEPGAQPNLDFHRMFVAFNEQVGAYWRDKRVSDVIRERAHDPSFGSVAVVRRAGLDLRNNLKFVSYGNINVLRVEVMQLLDEAFRVLDTDDVKRLFGAENAWDVVEEVLTRYFDVRLATSPRQLMAVSGREVLRWLAQPHVLQTSRAQFEALLLKIAEDSEEWLTSARAVGVADQPRRARRRTGGAGAPATNGHRAHA